MQYPVESTYNKIYWIEFTCFFAVQTKQIKVGFCIQKSGQLLSKVRFVNHGFSILEKLSDN